MSETYYINPDILLRTVDGSWIASNPRLRTHVELDESGAIALIKQGTGASLSVSTWSSQLESSKGRDRTCRGVGANGLHSDHSGLELKSTIPWVSHLELFELLQKRSIIINNPEDAVAKLKPLNGLFDREHLGTFHQRVGQYLFVEKRVGAHWKQWHDQKFSPDGKSLLGNSYREMQEPFFNEYFSTEYLEGKRILDFGCGNAFYTAKFAEKAEYVVGLDNSRDLLNIARSNHGYKNNLDLRLTESFEEVLSLMLTWEEGSFDLIYLQDTLLLLIQPEQEKPSAILPDLLKGFRRLLKPTGALCAMEPNPVFWLANRYGDPGNPYAIVTEFRHHVFNVAPNIDDVLKITSSAGLALKELKHPAPKDKTDKIRKPYQAEFPIWDFFVFVPLQKESHVQP